MKRYQAQSILHHLDKDDLSYSDVVVNWYRADRRKATAPYNRVIADYDDLDDLHTLYAEHFVDELFTEGEIEKLTAYLNRASGEGLALQAVDGDLLHTHRVTLPVKDPVIGYGDLPAGGLADRLRLTENPGYDLPFPVHGYFDLTKARYSDKLSQSVSYLHRALQSLGVDAGIKRDRIETVAEKLYLRDRLFVTRETTYQDWLDKIDV